MSLIINAFYSNKEIFLRELISNASDAMDKIQFQAAEDPSKLASEPNLYIRVTPDRDAGSVTVEDTGIGMTREEMILHLGTIAKSGTKAFMEAISSGADMSMIGQFGVGFYSSYLVSEKVRVVSKSNEGEQHVWESTAGGTFQVWKDETFEHGVLKRGTKVICFLKDDQAEFLECDRLKDLIMKHSAFVGFPIELLMEHRKEEQVEVQEEGETEPEKQTKVTVSHSWELLNKNKPLWLRPAEEVRHEEYADLYKWLAGDYEDHLAVKHILHSAQVDFKALLYCPRKAPKDMFDMGKMSQRFSIRLYVRRVFIKEFNDLIPKWMGFIKGIVDSDDMPLNISREMLQQNTILKHIKIALQKTCLQCLQTLARTRNAPRFSMSPLGSA
jgi:molecular chaperone HtpG